MQKNFILDFGFTKYKENEIDEFYELKKHDYEELFLGKYQKYIGGSNEN